MVSVDNSLISMGIVSTECGILPPDNNRVVIMLEETLKKINL